MDNEDIKVLYEEYREKYKAGTELRAKDPPHGEFIVDKVLPESNTVMCHYRTKEQKDIGKSVPIHYITKNFDIIKNDTP